MSREDAEGGKITHKDGQDGQDIQTLNAELKTLAFSASFSFTPSDFSYPAHPAHPC
jgi:hypothetical protein